MPQQKKSKKTALILGAGPAGLMAAWRLISNGYDVTILEKEKNQGGLGATSSFQGKYGKYYFDYGGHRFITHNNDLLKLVEELLGDDLLSVKRKSVIRFNGRIYDYPLSLGNLLKVAPLSLLSGAAFDLLKLPFTRHNNDNFAGWIKSRFGDTLYNNFFAGYTQKLWGIDPENLSADWAAQRISLIDLKDVARRLLPGKNNIVRTYSIDYRYPKYGFGVMFERLAAHITKAGGKFIFNAKINDIKYDNNAISAVIAGDKIYNADHYISTIAMPDMVKLLGGESSLKFRSLRFFNMPMEMDNLSNNTWQYLSDKNIMATRLQEPKRRSPFMAPKGHTSVMLEIPCNQGDEIWNMADDKLFKLICNDLETLGIDTNKATGEYFSKYAAQAYPLLSVGYEIEREKNITMLGGFNNLIQCGRQASFRYIFTDTAMEMGMMAGDSIINNQDMRRQIYDHRSEGVIIESQSIT